MDDQLLSMMDVARRLGISYQKLHQAHWSGKLAEPMKCGRVRLYTLADVERIKMYFAEK